MPRTLRFLLPSFADIFFLCPFLILSLSRGQDLLNDLGTGFHIRAGEYITKNFSVPRHDVFSYIEPAPSWVAHEWLSEVIMALVHDLSGLTGVVLFFSAVIGLTYFLLFKFVRAHGCNIILSSFLIFLAAVSSTLHWLARPHVFSLLLIVVWYFVLDLYHYKRRNYLYLLPPIMLLWVNLHGGFILGYILLGIYWLGNAAGALFLSETGREAHKDSFRALTWTALACGIFSLANPYGFHALLFPFKTVSQQFLIDVVMEYSSPNFHDALPFKYLLLLAIGTLAASRTKINLIELVLVVFFTYMALYSARHIPLFAIVVTPILARQTNVMLQRDDNTLVRLFNSRSGNLSSLDAQLKGHLWPVISLVAVCLLAKTDAIHFSFDERKAPVAALDFLQKEKLDGNMFNGEQFGDYLIYRAWPQYKVFIDGRSDMYGGDHVRQYFKVVGIQPGWKETLDKYDINFVLTNANSPLSVLLRQTDTWRIIYADNTADIFIRNVPANRELINKYPDVKLVL